LTDPCCPKGPREIVRKGTPASVTV
jgi:hypothetical protein